MFFSSFMRCKSSESDMKFPIFQTYSNLIISIDCNFSRNIGIDCLNSMFFSYI
jgi:hypothetical protein